MDFGVLRSATDGYCPSGMWLKEFCCGPDAVASCCHIVNQLAVILSAGTSLTRQCLSVLLYCFAEKSAS